MTISLRARGVHGVVLDIEGTTTPISFVYDVLFPYASEHLRDYITSHVGRPELDEPVRLLRAEWELDVARGEDPPPDMKDLERDARLECVVGYALWLMRRDRKSPGLKSLQGLIWQGGYADGSLRGEVYADVPSALRRWHVGGIGIGIYSSGSVLAQQLLFSTTQHGDLTQFMSGFFDTSVGAKREAESYLRIARTMAQSPGELLFVSDVSEELDAAQSAGLAAILCQRDAGGGAESVKHEVIRSFAEMDV